MSLPPSSFRSAIALLTIASSRCRDVPDKNRPFVQNGCNRSLTKNKTKNMYQIYGISGIK